MLNSMRITISCLVMMFALVVQAEAYKWVDDKGNVIYSDTPRPGAEKLKDREVQTYTAPRLPAQTTPTAEAKKPILKYKSVSVSSPANNTTLTDNTGTVNVSVSISPGLYYTEGHMVVLKVDGSTHGKPGTATSFTVNDLPRGSHQLQAVIVDKQGKPIISSTPVTVHVKRHFKKP